MTEDEKAKAQQAAYDIAQLQHAVDYCRKEYTPTAMLYRLIEVAEKRIEALTPAPVDGDLWEAIENINLFMTGLIDELIQAATSQKAREWKNPEEIPPPKDGTRFLAYDRANNQTPFVAFCADGDAEFRDDADSAWIEIEPLDWCEIPPYEATHKVIKIKGE